MRGIGQTIFPRFVSLALRSTCPFSARVKELLKGYNLEDVATVELNRRAPQDTMDILAFDPDRLGHALFLNPVMRDLISQRGIPIEIW